MVKSYNDPLKQKAREKQREFIQKHILSFKRPKDIHVVCFPGAEVEGEEALEIKEVYDPLGIPRENIVGLEEEVTRAQRLRKARLGIEVLELPDLEFFRTTSNKFDVISLDDTGQKTWRERDVIRYISGKDLLVNPGILMTNYAVKRESLGMKVSLLDRIFKGLDKVIMTRTLEESGRVLNDSIAETEKGIEHIQNKEYDLNLLRDEGITLDTIRAMGGGIIDVSPQKSFLVNLYLGKNLSPDLEERDSTFMKKLTKLTGGYKGIEAEVKDWHCNKALALVISKEIVKELEKRGLSNYQALHIAGVASVYHNGGRLFNALERYSYTSNKNMNMLSDLFLFSKISYKVANKMQDILYLQQNPLLLKINPRKLPKEELSDKADEIISLVHSDLPDQSHIPPVNYLGSSYSPMQRITEHQARELLSVGYTPREISECYRGFTKMQLAAFKAHLTMGTYKSEEK